MSNRQSQVTDRNAPTFMISVVASTVLLSRQSRQPSSPTTQLLNATPVNTRRASRSLPFVPVVPLRKLRIRPSIFGHSAGPVPQSAIPYASHLTNSAFHSIVEPLPPRPSRCSHGSRQPFRPPPTDFHPPPMPLPLHRRPADLAGGRHFNFP